MFTSIIVDAVAQHNEMIEAARDFGTRHGFGISTTSITPGYSSVSGRVFTDGSHETPGIRVGTFVMERVGDAVKADFFAIADRSDGHPAFGTCSCTWHTRLDGTDVLDRAYHIAVGLDHE
jgi:hypothetical protein